MSITKTSLCSNGISETEILNTIKVLSSIPVGNNIGLSFLSIIRSTDETFIVKVINNTIEVENDNPLF